MSDLEAALDQVRRVFSARPVPAALEYCTHCYSRREMEHLLRTPVDQLIADDLHTVLWNAFGTWGDWPSLAYYIPRILELYLAGDFDDEDILFDRLVVASRPERDRDARVGEPMTRGERQALQAFLLSWLETQKFEAFERIDWPDGLMERFAAAAALGPISSHVRRWKEGEPDDRAFWCGILTGLLECDYANRKTLPNCYLNGMTAHPENEELLLAEADPQAAIVYLVDNLEAVPLYGDELLGRVETAVGIR